MPNTSSGPVEAREPPPSPPVTWLAAWFVTAYVLMSLALVHRGREDAIG